MYCNSAKHRDSGRTWLSVRRPCKPLGTALEPCSARPHAPHQQRPVAHKQRWPEIASSATLSLSPAFDDQVIDISQCLSAQARNEQLRITTRSNMANLPAGRNLWSGSRPKNHVRQHHLHQMLLLWYPTSSFIVLNVAAYRNIISITNPAQITLTCHGCQHR